MKKNDRHQSVLRRKEESVLGLEGKIADEPIIPIVRHTNLELFDKRSNRNTFSAF
jgi:hypothetical protein